jgi:hypothetical protein
LTGQDKNSSGGIAGRGEAVLAKEVPATGSILAMSTVVSIQQPEMPLTLIEMVSTLILPRTIEAPVW